MREPYRETYRIERRTRELTDAEQTIVRAHVGDWDRRVRAQHLTAPTRMLVASSIAALVAAFGMVRGNHALVATAAIVGAIFAVIAFLGRCDALKLVASSRGPWHPPARGWRVIETHVFARSVVGAASGDEDYTHWLLYEVPGGTWFCLDPYGVAPPIDLARAELHLTRLAPWGPYLAATSTGDAIPHRGATDTPDGSGYASAVEAGYTWRPTDTPENDESGADALVEESALPLWARDLAQRSER